MPIDTGMTLSLHHLIYYMRVLLRKLPQLSLTCSRAQQQQPEHGELDKGSGSHPPCSAAALLLNHTTATRWEGYRIILWKQHNPQKGKGELFSTVTASVDGAFSYMSQELQSCLKRLLPGLRWLLFLKSICTLEIGFLIERANVAAQDSCMLCVHTRAWGNTDPLWKLVMSRWTPHPIITVVTFPKKKRDREQNKVSQSTATQGLAEPL